MPVNHASSVDKFLDYIPELIDKANNMIDKCKNKSENENKANKENIKEIKEFENRKKRLPL